MSENGHKILEETESYIEKMEAVERYRRESSCIEEPTSLSSDETPDVEVIIEKSQEEEEEEKKEEEEGEKKENEVLTLTVKAGEILKEVDNLEDEEEEEGIIVPGAVTYTVEGGLVQEDGIEEKEENKVVEEKEEQREEKVIEEKMENDGKEGEEKEYKEEEYTYKISEGTCNVDDVDKVSLYEYSAREDAAASSQAGGSKTIDQYYRDNGYPEDLQDPSQDIVAVTNGHLEDHKEEVMEEAIVEAAKEETKEEAMEKAKEEAKEEVIASLHEIIDLQPEPVPVPAPRTATAPNSLAAGAPSSPPVKINLSSVDQDIPLVKIESYVDRSQEELDFENMVKKNVSQYKAEKTKTNIEVLQSIEKEEGEDRPNVAKLLAWAKGTRKSKTETMVVRQKKHEDKIRKAVDMGGVNLVLAEKKTIIAEKAAETKPAAAKAAKVAEDTSTVHKQLVQQIASTLGVQGENCTVTAKGEGCHEVRFTAPVNGKQAQFCWIVRDNDTTTTDKEMIIKRDLAKKITSFVGASRKQDYSLPFSKVLYVDNKVTVLDEDPAYITPNQDKPLDELHLKVGMKALARLHAISYIYFSRNKEDKESLNLISNPSFLDPNLRSETKLNLEKNLENIILSLEQDGMSSSEVDRFKTLKNSLYNIYREAVNPENSILPVLCHGLPSLANIQFKYGADGIPLEARFINLTGAVYGSGLTDLHLFINTSGENTAREDFLLRFVYYETLVTLLKACGEKTVFSYDELKAEFVQKRLHGYIHASHILAEKRGKASMKTIATQASKPAQTAGPREVNSKILGKFIPGRAKVAAVVKLSTPQKKEDDGVIDCSPRIREMMLKALKI